MIFSCNCIPTIKVQFIDGIISKLVCKLDLKFIKNKCVDYFSKVSNKEKILP